MAFTTPELDAMIAEGAAAIPTTPLWEEIRDLLKAGYGAAVGAVTLGGSAGVLVTFADINSVDYDVFYFIEYDANIEAGSTGEIRIEKISQTQIRIYNTGSDIASLCHFRVVPR